MLSATDIKFRYSVKTGSAGNTTAQADPNASLGKYISTTAWSGGVLHDLFNLLTGDQNAAGQVDYRCVFVYNSSTTNIFYSPVLWISSQVAGGADLAIGVDPISSFDVNTVSAQANQITTTTTTPVSTIAFSAPVTKQTGLSLGDMLPGTVKGIWLRRTANNTVAVDNDGGTLRVEGDTSA